MVFSIFTDTCNYHHNQFSLCPKAISCCSVTQSCLTLSSLMDCRMSGFPVLHHLPESAQTHVHWISDVIQPSHPLLSPFSSCPQFFPASGSFQMSLHIRSLHIRWPKYWSFSFNISPSNEYSGLIFFRIDWFDLLTIMNHHKFNGVKQ